MRKGRVARERHAGDQAQAVGGGAQRVGAMAVVVVRGLARLVSVVACEAAEAEAASRCVEP